VTWFGGLSKEVLCIIFLRIEVEPLCFEIEESFLACCEKQEMHRGD